MQTKTSYPTATDHFCGLGGNTQGILEAGVEIVEAVNHDVDAVRTYAANHPQIDVRRSDLLEADPRKHPSANMLVASPDCQPNSDGNAEFKPTPQMLMFDEDPHPERERSRMTMWDVPNFASVHAYEIIIVENVVRIRASRDYPRWIGEMRKLGYDYKELYLNAMFFHPTPQSRDRIYIVFWRRGNPKPDLDYFPRGFCPGCERDVDAVQSWKNPNRPYGKYGKRNQYLYRCPTCVAVVEPYYYCAWNAIDWSLPCAKVGDRNPPLAPATKARIRAGIDRCSSDRAFLFPVAHGSGDLRVRRLNEALRTQTAYQTEAIAVPPPFIVEVAGRPKDHGPRSLNEAFSTIVATGNHHFLACPPPYLVENHGNSTASPITDPMATLCASAAHNYLAVPPPFVVVNNLGAVAHSLNDPLSTVKTVDGQALAVPPTFLASYYGTLNIRPLGAPVATVPTVDRHALVEAGRSTDVDDVGYRMLEPHELQRAQGFADSYQVLGSKRTRVWLIGNANPPKTMKWIIGRCADTLRRSRAH